MTIEIATGLATLAMTGYIKRHPEERSDVGIYLCEDAENYEIATGKRPRNDVVKEKKKVQTKQKV